MKSPTFLTLSTCKSRRIIAWEDSEQVNFGIFRNCFLQFSHNGGIEFCCSGHWHNGF